MFVEMSRPSGLLQGACDDPSRGIPDSPRSRVSSVPGMGNAGWSGGVAGVPDQPKNVCKKVASGGHFLDVCESVCLAKILKLRHLPLVRSIIRIIFAHQGEHWPSDLYSTIFIS